MFYPQYSKIIAPTLCATHDVLAMLVLTLLSVGFGGIVSAQEMEPRSYSPAPVGLHFAGATYLHSSGGVALDASLPIDNVDADMNISHLAYATTFDAFGRFASAGIALPYAWGEVSGDVQEQQRIAERDGFGDVRMRLSTNVYGGAAMDAKAFAARTPATQFGVSLTVVAPTGEYYSDRLINLGSNRWAVKPEVGFYQPLGKWALEGSAGVWLFEDNDDFYGDARREQDPLATTQWHLSYTVRPQLWIATSATWYRGGSTTVDGDHKSDRQDNSRIGVTVSLPVARGHSLKIAWSDGVNTRIGSDLTTVGIAWQYSWMSPP